MSRALHDEDYDRTRLVTLERLCDALDMHPVELFTAPTRAAQRRRMPLARAEQATDDAVLEAALTTLTDPVGHGRLAEALGWPLDRLGAALAALAALEERLADTGMRVDHEGGPQATIRGLRPRDALLTDPSGKPCTACSTSTPASIRATRGCSTRSPCAATRPPRPAVPTPSPLSSSSGRGYLVRRHNSERLAASDDPAFSLLLDDPDY